MCACLCAVWTAIHWLTRAPLSQTHTLSGLLAQKEPLARVAVWSSSQKRNSKFEVNMLNLNWGQWKVPMCVSYQGLFVHKEIDG